MQKNWVRVLQTFRESDNFALFALLSALDNVQFTADQIIIPTHDATEYAMLTKHLPELQAASGGADLVINPPDTESAAQNQMYLQKLQELFGDKLEIL